MHKFLARLTLASVFAASSAVTAQADVIFTDDFESTQNLQGWQVYQDISDGAWTVTAGTGVEVQKSVVVDAHSGDQYIELDSSSRRGGSSASNGTNSAITRSVSGLAAGDYVLEYYYQPRTAREDDNVISAFVDNASDDLFTNLLDTANGVGSDGWVHRTVSFTLAEDNSDINLSFRAEGIQNSLGGFIDTVSLQNVSQVPAPAGLGFIVFGVLVMGAAAWRNSNRKRQTQSAA